jgi:hypothetical protein
MNNKITAPGVGGACAVLFCWHLRLAYGIEANTDQAAALASIFTVVFGFFDDIVAGAKSAILSQFQPKES